MKLWQRYLLREFLKVFILFLFGFYFLYITIDYCSHMQDFVQGKKIAFGQIILFYLYQFVKRCDILLPLAFMISSMKLLLGWNNQRELVAFQAGGLSWKKLVSPLIVVATILCLTNLSIAEFALPKALRRIDRFHDTHMKHSHSGNRSEPIHVLQLEDHSKLVYKHYDNSQDRFIDVIWVRSPSDLWRMKALSANPDTPIGYFVDHLEKRPEGHFEKSASFEAVKLQELKWDKQMTRRGFVPYENRSLSELAKLWIHDTSKYAAHEIQTQLLFKFLMPFLPLLVILSIAPFCVRYSRQISFFFYYSISLFAYVAFVALMDACVILGENATIAPLYAILIPFLIPFAFFSFKYAKS